MKRAKVDAVIVGLGWAGSLMANELTQAGLNVVAVERGGWRDTSSDFPTSMDTDELRYATRRELLQPLSVETVTFRNCGISIPINSAGARVAPGRIGMG
jgi:gluconate 2-dehydrogenase alpha chain